MSEHCQQPVTPFTVSGDCSVAGMIEAMAGTSFQARALAQGVAIWRQMLEGEVTVFFGLAGAMIPAGMRQVLVYMIQNRLVDCVVSTGANLFHDVHESLGRYHWQGHHHTDDRRLARDHVFRIYDVLAKETEFDQSEDFITQFSLALDASRPYSTREYLHLLGKKLAVEAKEPGLLSTAARAGVPVFCPALGDSVFGTALAAARVKQGCRLVIDMVQDVTDIIRIITASSRSTGVVFVGGGNPKNFIQQAELCGYIFDRQLKGHDYAIQVTTDSPQWGGLSGCTFEEALTWRKVAPQAHTVTIYCDATIALPIMVTALAQGSAEVIAHRKKPALNIPI